MASKQNYPNKKVPIGVKVLTGGIAGSIAEIVSMPIDTAKVRLQIQGSQHKHGDPIKYKGMVSCMYRVAREEGVRYLYKGMVAGLQRQMLFASLRNGLYDAAKSLLTPRELKGDSPFSTKILAGVITSAFGITIANPTDVVKVRLQAEGRSLKSNPQYKNTTDAYVKILKQEGGRGFWRGLGPNLMRNSVVNAVELASYDEIKSQIISYGLLKDGAPCHFVSAACAGLSAVLIGSPFDVVKTRMMNSRRGIGQTYRNSIHCIVITLENEV